MSTVFSRLTLSLFAAAVALRLLIAPGLMPVATPHGVSMVECAGQMQHRGGKPVKPICPFAAVAAPAVAPVTPVLAWTSLEPTVPPAPTLTPVARAHGPPSDRPPSTGPPWLA